MARARNIKPGFFKNEDLAECSLAARLCFAGLWTLADRDGRLEDRPKRIKAELFAFDSFDVEPLLSELARHAFIIRYEVEGQRCIQISKFSTHQTPHYSEKPSVIKPPRLQESSRHEETELQEDSRKEVVIKRGAQPPDSLNPDSLNPESPKPPPGAGFEAFWTAWPKSPWKGGKAECEKVWRKDHLEALTPTIVAHVKAMALTAGWTKQNRDFVPAPVVYLRGKRWDGAETGGSAAVESDVYAGAV